MIKTAVSYLIYGCYNNVVGLGLWGFGSLFRSHVTITVKDDMDLMKEQHKETRHDGTIELNVKFAAVHSMMRVDLRG